MAAPPPRPLSLPEEFVLLSYRDSGTLHDSAQAAVGCAAAELGELALRRKLLVRSRKTKILGFDVYRLHGAEIQLLDTSRTDVPWIDELLAELERRAGAEHGRVRLNRWLRQHREAFTLHRGALAERRALHHKPGGYPGPFRILGREHYYPDNAVRDALIAEVRAATSGQSRFDEHTLFLHDLVEATELSKSLGVTSSLRQRLDRGRGVGAVEFLPEDLRDTSSVLASSVSMRSRHGD
jgi:hypothetical protein